MDIINQKIASELGVAIGQVAAAVELLGEGATVPFIARYRKEKTGGLDDTQLRKLETRLGYLRELEERRATVLKSITEQGKLTPELAKAISGAATKVELEDLYAPFKPKRRTKAQIAREAGLEPLADALLKNPALSPEARGAEVHRCRQGRRRRQGRARGRAAHPRRAHRRERRPRRHLARMAVGRGRAHLQGAEGQERGRRQVRRLLRLRPAHQGHALAPGAGHAARAQRGHPRPRSRRGARGGQAASGGRQDHGRLRHRRSRPPGGRLAGGDGAAGVEDEARALAAVGPARAAQGAGRRRGDLGVLQEPARSAAGGAGRPARDDGARSRASARACKVAVVDQTGKVVETATIYPHEPKSDWQGSLATLAALCMRHKVDLVSVGNGTASRETDKLVAELIAKMPQLKLTKVMVSEAGASVYSASELAAQGVSRPRRHRARRGVDRAPAAGPAGGAGQDRAEGDRRRAVSARRRPGRACPLARRGGGGLRQLASASTSTRRRRRCWRTCRASTRRSPPTSSPSATTTAPSSRAAP